MASYFIDLEVSGTANTTGIAANSKHLGNNNRFEIVLCGKCKSISVWLLFSVQMSGQGSDH